MAIAVLHAFLRQLARNVALVEERATQDGAKRILNDLGAHLAAHIPNLGVAIHGADAPAGRLAALLVRFRGKPATPTVGAEEMKALVRAGDEGLRLIARRILELDRDSIDQAFALLSNMKVAAGRPIAFMTVGFPTTWAPLSEQLTRAGVPTYAICLYDFRQSLETGVLNTTEIPVSRAVVLDFIGHLIVLAAGSPGVLLINGDAYYGANWDIARTTLMYLLTGSMLAAAREAGAGRGELVALKYDAIQPVFARDATAIDRDPAHMLLSDMYRFSMRQADRIIYNANSPAMGEFNEESVPLSSPRLHFYRYASRPERQVAKADEEGREIHVVILSSFLSDSEDHTRNHQAEIVRAILRQGVHVHYFCNIESPAVDAFRRILATDAQRFHPHAIVRDQRALVEEVQRYDLGLVLSDDAAFLKSIEDLRDPFYRQAEAMLRSTTMNSGAFVFAAAGLPFVYPRYMTGIGEVFGDGTAMPMAPSEMDGFRRAVDDWDLPRRKKLAEAARDQMWMESNIARFSAFVGCGRPPSP